MMSTDLNEQIRELMERGLRPVTMADIKTREPVRARTPRKATARPGLRRGGLILAGTAGIAGSAALAVAALLSGSTEGNVGRAVLTAWTVQPGSHGTVKVTIRELRNPAGLQSLLRADGIPANVVFLQHSFTPTTSPSAIPRSCRAPHMSDKANANLQEKILPAPHFSTGTVLIIRPSAMPRHIGLFIEAWAAPGSETHPALALQVDLVVASTRCTGS
jgi:hypothetical protein